MEGPRILVAACLAAGVSLVACSDDDASMQDGSVSTAADSTAGDVVQASCTRWILTDEVRNGRDIGGWPVEGGKETACEKFYHGGDLTRLDQQCADFAQIGIKTVVDLRAESEQAAAPNAACVADSAQSITAALPKLLPDTPENYKALLDAGEAWKTLFDALADEQKYPVYTHCIIGRDRGGLAGSMVMLALGATEETTAAEFRLSEEADIELKLESHQAFLAELETRGGIEAYLDSVGVDAVQLTKIRSLLLE